MPATITPDAKAMRRFHEAIAQLRRISGKDFETVIKAEVGAVLANTVRNTKKATVKSIEKNHHAQPGARYAIEYAGPVSRTGKTYTPKEVERLKRRAAERRGQAKGGKLLYYLPGSNQPHKHPSWAWNKIEDFRAKRLIHKKQARGLTASMWVKIGEGLGISVAAPGYVKNARHHRGGDMKQMLEIRSKGHGNTYELGFINKLSHVNKWTRAGLSFRRALNARANYFSQSLKLAAKQKIKGVLDRYPGLGRVS